MSSSSAQAFAAGASSPMKMVSSGYNENESNDESDGNNNEQSNIPQLPSSKDNNDEEQKDIPVLKFGDTMKFEHLGPVIINVSLNVSHVNRLCSCLKDLSICNHWKIKN